MTRPDVERDARRERLDTIIASWSPVDLDEALRDELVARLMPEIDRAAGAENERLAKRLTMVQASADATHKACSDAVEARGVVANDNAHLRKLLSQVEWAWNNRRCPICSGWDSDNGGEGDFRHASECLLRAALAAPPAATPPRPRLGPYTMTKGKTIPNKPKAR